MSKRRSIITHSIALVLGMAIAGPLAMAIGHTEKGIEAGDWMNLPASIVGALIGGLFTYLLQPKAAGRGGPAAVNATIRDLRNAARRTAKLNPDGIGDDALLDEAIATAKRLTSAADRYQYARALTPPEEAVAGWIDLDAAVLELKSGLRDAERALSAGYERDGPDLIRRHLHEVKARFGEQLERIIDRVTG